MRLDGRLGAAGASAGQPWLYLLDGRSVAARGMEIETPGSYRCTIVGCDDRAKTVTVRERLPEGLALAGSPFVLDMPYNECYTVAKVLRDGEGSVVHLSGLPNLFLRRGHDSGGTRPRACDTGTQQRALGGVQCSHHGEGAEAGRGTDSASALP